MKGRKERGKDQINCKAKEGHVVAGKFTYFVRCEFGRRMQIFGTCPLTDRVGLRQPSCTPSTHML